MKRNLIPFAIAFVSLSLSSPAEAANSRHLTRLLKTNACANCDLRQANLRGLDLSRADLRGADLRGAQLRSAKLLNANLSQANLTRANLSYALLIQANISGTRFRFADLSYATLQEATATQSADFSGARLEGTILPDGRVAQPRDIEPATLPFRQDS